MNYLKSAIQRSIVSGLVVAVALAANAQAQLANPNSFQGNVIQGTVVPGNFQGGFVQQGFPQQGFPQGGVVVQTEQLLAEPTEEELKQPRIGVSLNDTGSSPSVRSVFTNSPASQAGIQSGDLITKINGKAVANVADFNAMLGDIGAGSSFQLTHSRDGKEADVSVSAATLGDIVNASIVPEAGAFDSAIQQSEIRMSSTKQRIKNAEMDLEDLKKNLMEQEKEMMELKSKAEAAEKAEMEKKAMEAKEAAMKKEEMMKKEAGSGN